MGNYVEPVLIDHDLSVYSVDREGGVLHVIVSKSPDGQSRSMAAAFEHIPDYAEKKAVAAQAAAQEKAAQEKTAETPNTSNPDYLFFDNNNEKLTSEILFTSHTEAKVTGIEGTVTVPNGGPAGLMFFKVTDDVNTPLVTTEYDTNGSVGAVQSLPLSDNTNLKEGDVIKLLVTSGALSVEGASHFKIALA